MPWLGEIAGLQPGGITLHPLPICADDALPSRSQGPLHPLLPLLLAGVPVPHLRCGPVPAEEGVQGAQQLQGGGGQARHLPRLLHIHMVGVVVQRGMVKDKDVITGARNNSSRSNSQFDEMTNEILTYNP